MRSLLPPSLTLSVVLGLACSRGESAPSRVEGAESSERPPSDAETAAPPLVQARSAPEPHLATKALLAWTSALNAGNVESLEGLYAPRVLFYGAWKSRAEVLSAKRTALAATPNYQQRVDRVRIENGPAGFVVRFDKLGGAEFKSVVGSRLVLESTEAGLRIVEETDVVTDKRLKRPPAEGCTEAALDAISNHPAIRGDVRRVVREFPHVNPGGLVYEEGKQSVEAAFGYMHPTHFEARWWIAVREGQIVVRDALTEDRLELSLKERTRVRQACFAENGHL